jgi:hypothetical protein
LAVGAGRARRVALARIRIFFFSVNEVSYLKLGDLTNVFVFTQCVCENARRHEGVQCQMQMLCRKRTGSRLRAGRVCWCASGFQGLTKGRLRLFGESKSQRTNDKRQQSPSSSPRLAAQLFRCLVRFSMHTLLPAPVRPTIPYSTRGFSAAVEAHKPSSSNNQQQPRSLRPPS